MAKTNFDTKDYLSQNFETYTEPQYINVPFSNIQNRAQVLDSSKMLQPVLGVERLLFKSINLVRFEFGPANQNVFELDSKESRVRFVGNWNNISNGSGSRPTSSSANDFVEITFYGTGLNILSLQAADTRAMLPSINGGAEGSNIYAGASASSILTGRNYNSNQILSVTSGLTLGWNTVKLRVSVGTVNIYAFEILNERSNLAITPGVARISGNKNLLLNLTTSNYNAGITGTTGARVLKYLQNNVISQAVQEVSSVAQPELVNNGTFDTNISGWTINGTMLAVFESNAVRLTRNGSGNAFYQTIATVIGNVYTVNYNVKNIAGTAGGTVEFDALDGTGLGGSVLGFMHTVTTANTYTFSFKALSATTTLKIFLETQTNVNALIDDISVKIVPFKFLTNTDHSNEEILKKINFREFGAQRADDFSTLGGSSSNRIFTLDDGTTTLTGSNVTVLTVNGVEFLAASGNGNYTIITFTGTGLDIVRNDGGTGSTNPNSAVLIDGINVGNISLVRSNITRIEKICSGLPYGTHTVRISNPSASGLFWPQFSDFIIYQPKKPTLPAGAIELADYNVMANYVQVLNPNPGIPGRISSGVMRKMVGSREASFNGTWTLSLDIGFSSGNFNRTTTATNYAEYVFYGTGVDVRLFIGNGANNFTFSIDGNSNLSSYTTNYSGAGTGLTFTNTTGVLSGTAAGYANYDAAVFSVSGLSLGKHTIRVTQNASIQLCIDTFDIITPIHVNSPHLKIGNLPLLPNAKFTGIASPTPDLTTPKALLVYDPSNARILSSIGIFQVLRISTGVYYIFFDKAFKDSNYTITTNGAAQTRTIKANKKATYCQINSYNSSGTLTDYFLDITIFGELITD